METTQNEVEYLIVSCPNHGAVACPDQPTLDALFPAVMGCAAVLDASPAEARDHLIWHVANGSNCWACCPEARFDPFGHATI